MAAVRGIGIEQPIDEFPVSAFAKRVLGLRVIPEFLEFLLFIRQAADARLKLGVAVAKLLLDAPIDAPGSRGMRGRPMCSPPHSGFSLV